MFLLFKSPTCFVRLLLLFYLPSDSYRLIHKKFHSKPDDAVDVALLLPTFADVSDKPFTRGYSHVCIYCLFPPISCRCVPQKIHPILILELTTLLLCMHTNYAMECPTMLLYFLVLLSTCCVFCRTSYMLSHWSTYLIAFALRQLKMCPTKPSLSACSYLT